MKDFDLRKYLAENKLLKEFTVPGGNYSNSYGNNQAEEQLTSPEDYEIFIELFPQGEASRILMDPKRKELYDQHLEWTKDSQYNNTFEHMQYHIINHDGETYKAHQTQYYNNNYKDFRDPRFTELMISKDGKRMGTYLVDTKEYIKDLNDLESQGKLGPRVSENKSLQENRLEGLIREKLCKKGEAYRKRRMAAGEKSSAYLSGRAVKVCKGQMSGKKKKKTNEVEDRVSESLRDWFKKEDWVRIDTQGNISGKCGTMKNKKVPSRCLPRKKAQSLTKAERKASAQKKKREGKKGKQFVKNPK
jgi:hypothetical protein